MANIKLDRTGFLMGFGAVLFGVGIIAFLRLNKKQIDEEQASINNTDENGELHFNNNEKDLKDAKRIIFNENYKTIDKADTVPYHLIGLNGSSVQMPGEAEDIDIDTDPAEFESPPEDEAEPEIYDEETANEESYYNPVSDYNDDPNAIEYEDGPEEEETVQVFPERDAPTEYPYEISYDEYEHAQEYGAGPEQETLTWYAKDKILVNESDNTIVKNPAKLIGNDIFTEVKASPSHIRYVRNEMLGIDFEIYYEKGHYEGLD